MKEKLLNHKANLRVMSKFPKKIRHTHTYTYTHTYTHACRHTHMITGGKSYLGK